MKIEMSVIALGLDGPNCLVLLSDQTRARALPIYIGGFEARAISRVAARLKSQRPTTHELLFDTVRQLGFNVREIEIDSLEGETYFAKIKLVAEDGDGTRTLDARPSDAIALALAAGAPIMVSSEVMERGTIPFSEKVESEGTGNLDPAEIEQFKEFLQNVKASDFKLPGFTPDQLPEE